MIHYKGNDFVIMGNFFEDIAWAKDISTNKYCYVEKDGTLLTQPIFDKAYNFCNGYAKVCIDNKDYGLIDYNGQYAVEPRFDDVGQFHCGLAYIEQEGLFGYVDTLDHVIVEPIYEKVDNFKFDKAYVLTIKGLWGCIDINGHYMNIPEFEECYNSDFYDENDNKMAITTIKTNDISGVTDNYGFILSYIET